MDGSFPQSPGTRGRSLCGKTRRNMHTTSPQALKAFAGANGGWQIYVPFVDLFYHWDDLTLCGPRPCDRATLSRFHVSTALPNWHNPNTTFVRAPLGRAPAQGRPGLTPFEVAGFFTQTAIGRVLQRTGANPTASDVLRGWYDVSVFHVDDLFLGPYVSQDCATGGCLCNVGVRRLSSYRLDAFVRGSEPEVDLRFSSCTINYDPPEVDGVPIDTILILSGVALLVMVCQEGIGGCLSVAFTTRQGFVLVSTFVGCYAVLCGRSVSLEFFIGSRTLQQS